MIAALNQVEAEQGVGYDASSGGVDADDLRMEDEGKKILVAQTAFLQQI